MVLTPNSRSITFSRNLTYDKNTVRNYARTWQRGAMHTAVASSSHSMPLRAARQSQTTLLSFSFIIFISRTSTHNTYKITETKQITHAVYVKEVAPLKLFAIFSLVVNLCNWILPWLLPRHIPAFTPILVHLSEYLYELYSNFNNSI